MEPNQPGTARAQELDLEKMRIENDFEIKKQELDLKRQELQARLEESKQSSRQISPVVAGIIAAVLGLLGTGIGAYMQGQSNLDLEREKFQSQMILKGLEINQPIERAKYLSFLTQVGLIPEGKMAANLDSLIKEPDDIPLLAPPAVRQESGFSLRVPDSPRSIEEIIISDTQSPDLQNELRGLQAEGVSYHYLIDKNGDVTRLGDESFVAFHTAGRNERSLGIGLIHRSGKEDYPEAQLESLRRLLVDLGKRHRIPPQKMLTKSEVDPRKPMDLTRRIGELRSQVSSTPP